MSPDSSSQKQSEQRSVSRAGNPDPKSSCQAAAAQDGELYGGGSGKQVGVSATQEGGYWGQVGEKGVGKSLGEMKVCIGDGLVKKRKVEETGGGSLQRYVFSRANSRLPGLGGTGSRSAHLSPPRSARQTPLTTSTPTGKHMLQIREVPPTVFPCYRREHPSYSLPT